jgi:hypothetical protein
MDTRIFWICLLVEGRPWTHFTPALCGWRWQGCFGTYTVFWDWLCGTDQVGARHDVAGLLGDR